MLPWAPSMYTYSVKQTRTRHFLPFLAIALFTMAIAGQLQAQQLKLSQSFSGAAVSALKAINATGWAMPSSVRELEIRQAEGQRHAAARCRSGGQRPKVHRAQEQGTGVLSRAGEETAVPRVLTAISLRFVLKNSPYICGSAFSGGPEHANEGFGLC